MTQLLNKILIIIIIVMLIVLYIYIIINNTNNTDKFVNNTNNDNDTYTDNDNDNDNDNYTDTDTDININNNTDTNFDNSIQTLEKKSNITSVKTISTLLQEQLALKLNISYRRLTNIKYTGNLDNKILNISFTILDTNLTEIKNGEQNTQTVVNKANNLFNTNKFIVNINGVNINLHKINNRNNKNNTNNNVNDNNILNKGINFNNSGLQDISTYVNNKYISAPNDKKLTQFYELKYDTKFKLNPVLST